MSTLFSPFELRSVALENRIVVSPMCQYSAHDGIADDWHLVNLGHLALGGAGLVFFEATHVSPEARITPSCLGIYGDDHERAMRRIVEFVHSKTPAKVGVQLAHAGRKASTTPPWDGGAPIIGSRGWQPLGASALPYTPDGPAVRALDLASIKKVRRDFVDATRRCLRMNADVIELHFAHGYLVHQFLSPLSNQRTDEYGGSLENRMRFAIELFDDVRSAWPSEKALGVRISATDYVVGGWDLDESIALCKELSARGCDFVDVSSGGLSPLQKIDAKPGYQVGFSRTIRDAADIATIAVGMIVDPQQAEQILAHGDADLIAMARGMIRDPRWAWGAADELGATAFVPNQYARGRSAHHQRIPSPKP